MLVIEQAARRIQVHRIDRRLLFDIPWLLPDCCPVQLLQVGQQMNDEAMPVLS